MNTTLTNIGLLLFRVSISLFMIFGHGLGKFQKLISGNEIKFLDPFGIGAYASFSLAAFAEFFASILLLFGIFTRLSSFSLIITMTIAVFIAHSDDPFSSKEKPLLYLASYVLIFLLGPGKYSLQTFLNKRVIKSKGLIKSILS